MRFSGRAFDDGYARVAPSAETSLVIQSILATFLCWAGNGLAFFGIFHPPVYDRHHESFRTFRCTMPAIYEVPQ